jgi:hypothetical protein
MNSDARHWMAIGDTSTRSPDHDAKNAVVEIHAVNRKNTLGILIIFHHHCNDNDEVR